jgi:uncharacterized membrane protein
LTELGPRSGTPETRIVVEPNRSLSLRGTIWIVLGMLVMPLALYVLLTAEGFWPVLPIAAFEWLMLVLALAIWRRRSRYRETITVAPEEIRVDIYDGRREHRFEFNRHWAHVELRHPAYRLHSTRLFIRSHGTGCEIGRCLTDDERESLADRLGSLIGGVAQAPKLD